jgi:uncharacterized repeat protein (TIGR03837 family)
MSRTWDVFCKVVDNYGDAAVCWRLAVQLSSEQGAQVRLWIDELPALQALCPEIQADLASQTVFGVEVCLWSTDGSVDAPGEPADIVIEAFGCGLPDRYVDAMAARDPRPVWVILEYLSAESWVRSHHKLPSPHPRLPLERHFFFPGFVHGTGGLLHEAALETKRAAFQRSPESIDSFWRKAGFESPPAGAIAISLFGYENPVVGKFLEMWSQGPHKVVVAVPSSKVRSGVSAFFGAADPGNGGRLARDHLEVRLLPFLPQPRYDELLWACDWNFVRGEDSFVRAQWAERPFAWQIYPQAGDTHRLKLDAFLDLYCAKLEPEVGEALRRLWHAWNGYGTFHEAPIHAAWGGLQTAQDPLLRHGQGWSAGLQGQGDLAANLAQFCEERLK